MFNSFNNIIPTLIGNHSRQDSMEPWEEYSENGPKPTVLER